MAQLDAIGFEWSPPKGRKSMPLSSSRDDKPAPVAATRRATSETETAAVPSEGGVSSVAEAPPAHYQGYFEETGVSVSDAMAMDQDNVPQPQDDDHDPQAEDSESNKNERAPFKKRAPRDGKKTPRGDFGDKEKKRKVWNERFEELKAFEQQHGNCNVPGRCKEHPSLGRW